jgi:hypothetical protein
MDHCLIELTYLGPIQYYSKFFGYDTVVIEQHEHYQKGSFRNRLHISGPQGLHRLTIPLRSGKHQQMPIREVEIAYDEPWAHQHRQAIQSAYGNSPFFEFYAPELLAVYEQPPKHLYDFNWQLLELITSWITPPATLQQSDRFEKHPQDQMDLRNRIRPRPQEDPHFKSISYPQVFTDKHGFLPNLSIIDLLFCQGPQTPLILEQCFVTPPAS